MSVGEIIPIEINDPITVYVDGLPMIRGKYGVKMVATRSRSTASSTLWNT